MEDIADKLSKNQFSVIVVPIVCGVLFVVAAYMKALVFEFLLFFIGLLVLIVQIPFIIKWCYKKEFKLVLLCFASTIIFFGLILFGGYFDATLFYAT